LDRLGQEKGIYIDEKDSIDIIGTFPGLKSTSWIITSEKNCEYNCIAWAAGDCQNWWWPGPYSYWPENVARECTIDSFKKAFENS